MTRKLPIILACVILTIMVAGCSSSPYKGQRYNGEPHGYGTYSYKDGTVYKGQFRYGKPYGFGTIIYPDGRKEKVAYKAGKRIYTQQGIQNMQSSMRWIDRSVARNKAIRLASERADRRAIEQDRKRRNALPAFNPNRTYNSHYSSGRYSAKTICQSYNYISERNIYKKDLHEARSCKRISKQKCERTMSYAYAYGRRAKKYLHKCGTNLYSIILGHGQNICLASARGTYQRQKCDRDFHPKYGVFR